MKVEINLIVLYWQWVFGGYRLLIIMIGCITLAVGITLVVLFTFTCTATGKQELPTPMRNCVTL